MRKTKKYDDDDLLSADQTRDVEVQLANFVGNIDNNFFFLYIEPIEPNRKKDWFLLEKGGRHGIM